MALATNTSGVRWSHIVPTLGIAWIFNNVDKLSVGIVMASAAFLTETGLKGHMVELGLLTTVMLISYAVGTLFWGQFINRIGIRRTFAIGMALWVLSMLGYGLAHSYTQLLISRILLGWGEGVMYPVCNAYISNWFPDRERARATSFWYSGQMIGFGVAGVGIVTLLHTFGWRGVYFTLALLQLIVTLPMAWWLTRDNPDQHRKVSRQEIEHIASGRPPNAEGEDLGWTFLSNYRWWLLAGAWMFQLIMYWAWATWMATYLHHTRGYSLTAMGEIMSIGGGFGPLIFMNLAGWISDKIGYRALFGFITYLIDALLIVISVRLANALTAVILFSVVIAINPIGNMAVQALHVRLVNRRTIGRATGAMYFVGQMGSSFSPTLFGLIVGRSGNFVNAFDFMAASLVVAAACFYFLIPVEKKLVAVPEQAATEVS